MVVSEAVARRHRLGKGRREAGEEVGVSILLPEDVTMATNTSSAVYQVVSGECWLLLLCFTPDTCLLELLKRLGLVASKQRSLPLGVTSSRAVLLPIDSAPEINTVVCARRC